MNNERLTAEEFLKDKGFAPRFVEDYSLKIVMDEYAEQQSRLEAIEFAGWINKCGFKSSTEGTWYIGYKFYTSDELFNLYIKQKSK